MTYADGRHVSSETLAESSHRLETLGLELDDITGPTSRSAEEIEAEMELELELMLEAEMDGEDKDNFDDVEDEDEDDDEGDDLDFGLTNGCDSVSKTRPLLPLSVTDSITAALRTASALKDGSSSLSEKTVSVSATSTAPPNFSRVDLSLGT